MRKAWKDIQRFFAMMTRAMLGGTNMHIHTILIGAPGNLCEFQTHRRLLRGSL